MSKLLKEAQVRRFMALANIGALSDTFVNEDSPYAAKEEEPGEDIRKGAEKRGAEGTLAKTKGHGKVDYVKENDEWGGDEGDESETHPGELDFEGGEGDEVVDDLEVADVEEEPGVEVPEEIAVDVITTIANALEAEYGLAVDVQAGADLGPEEAEAEVDLGVEEPAIDGEEFEAEVEVEDELAEVDMVDEDEIVAEVLKRVTERLRTALKKEKKTRIRAKK